MPTDVALIVGGVAAVFVIFALALAWADYYSSSRPAK